MLAAYMVDATSMTTSMSLAAIVYVAGAALWFAMPETRKRTSALLAQAELDPPIPPARNET